MFASAFPRLPHRPMGFWWGKERAEVPVLREGSGCWGWDLFKVPNPAEAISFGEDFFEHFEHGSLLNVSSCILLFFWVSYVMHSVFIYHINWWVLSFPSVGRWWTCILYIRSHIPISTQGVLYGMSWGLWWQMKRYSKWIKDAYTWRLEG